MTNRDLPRVYVLELACEGCERPDTVFYGDDANDAWTKAMARGWRPRSGKVYCPPCAAGLRRRTR